MLDGLVVRPVPVQRPGPPIWVAVRRGNMAPLRRAARHDGMFPIGVDHPDQLAELVAQVHGWRPDDEGGFEVAIGGNPDTDPRPYAAVGATWWMTRFSPFEITAEQVRGAIRDHPW